MSPQERDERRRERTEEIRKLEAIHAKAKETLERTIQEYNVTLKELDGKKRAFLRLVEERKVKGLDYPEHLLLGRLEQLDHETKVRMDAIMERIGETDRAFGKARDDLNGFLEIDTLERQIEDAPPTEPSQASVSAEALATTT